MKNNADEKDQNMSLIRSSGSADSQTESSLPSACELLQVIEALAVRSAPVLRVLGVHTVLLQCLSAAAFTQAPVSSQQGLK